MDIDLILKVVSIFVHLKYQLSGIFLLDGIWLESGLNLSNSICVRIKEFG